MDIDSSIRIRVFEWLNEQCQIHGDTLSRDLLSAGLVYKGERIPLLGPQGIFKPRVLPQIPLSITTSPKSPYNDGFDKEGSRLFYKYRGLDPDHRDNVGLRLAMERKIPLVYLFGLIVGKYLPVWPVYIVGDNKKELTFEVSIEQMNSSELLGRLPDLDALERKYTVVTTRHRLHQQRFRERILHAYREQCAMCKLRHSELLEAVHIIPDSEKGGDPEISNGIAMCKLHHTAFDRFLIGIRPDYIIEIRKDILNEKDGPVLQHGIIGLNNKKIEMPSRRHDYPDPNRLENRYKKFQAFKLVA
jgi:putative restriction endonuclease